MIKHRWLILFILLFFKGTDGIGKSTTKCATLPDLITPQSIQLDDDRIYITDGHRVFIYTRRNFELNKIFGQKGEGEEQFTPVPRGNVRLRIDVQSEHLVVNSHEKVSIFTKDGQFISSKKAYHQTEYAIPMGDHYIVAYYVIHPGTGKSSKHILIFNDQLEFEKKIAEGFLGSGKARGFGGPDRMLHVDMVPDYYDFQIYQDNIYIANSKNGCFLEVYDSEGIKLFEISHAYEKGRVSEKYKKSRRNKILERYDHYRDHIAIDDAVYYPAIQKFIVTDNKIYVFHYQIDENNQAITVFDTQGNVINKRCVPESDISTIRNGQYIFLQENKNGEWELHMMPVL